jgi:D-glycero-D-manno-heptose 1,7-bisphosphate phosphatase
MRRVAAFLDRDGVLIENTTTDGRPRPLPEGTAEILPGVLEACRTLQDAGLVLIGVSNQPDIARGMSSTDAVTRTNGELRNRLGLDALLMCPHDDADDCRCRKPRPGMLLEGAVQFGLDLRRSVMVGDRWRDIEAGRRAGCATVFVDRGYGERKPEGPDVVVASLADAVPYILSFTAGTRGREERDGERDDQRI